jgi:hypothetical protein
MVVRVRAGEGQHFVDDRCIAQDVLINRADLHDLHESRDWGQRPCCDLVSWTHTWIGRCIFGSAGLPSPSDPPSTPS